MKTHIQQNTNGYWNLYVNGKLAMADESYTVASNLQSILESGSQQNTECGEVAESILREEFLATHMQDNKSDSARLAEDYQAFGM